MIDGVLELGVDPAIDQSVRRTSRRHVPRRKAALMALYVSAGRRFRRTRRDRRRGVADRARRRLADRAPAGRRRSPIVSPPSSTRPSSEATGLERLGIEYEQVLGRHRRPRQQCGAAARRPPRANCRRRWTGRRGSPVPSGRRCSTRCRRCGRAAIDEVPLEEFTAATVAAAALLRQELGAEST